MATFSRLHDCQSVRWRLDGRAIGRLCNWKALQLEGYAIGRSCDWMVLQLDRLVQLATHCNWKGLQLDGNCWGSWRNLADCKTVRVLYSPPAPSLPCLITFSLFIVKRRAAGRWPPPVARKKEATVTHPTPKKLRFKHSQPSNCFQGRRYVLNLPCVVVSLSSNGFSVLCGKGSQPRIPSPWRLNRRAFNVDRG